MDLNDSAANILDSNDSSEQPPSWTEGCGYTPCDEEEATHLVVGDGEMKYGQMGCGILAYCSNQIMAWRCLREIKKNPLANAQVMPNSLELREGIERALLEKMREENIA